MWVIFSLVNYLVIGIILYLMYVFFVKRRNNKDERVVEFSTIAIPKNLLWAILLILLAFNVFVYNTHVGIGIGLFFALVALAVYYTFPSEKRSTLIKLIMLGVVIISIAVGFRANGFVQGLNIAIAVALLTLVVGIHASAIIRWKGLWLISLLWRVFILSLSNIPALLRNATQQEIGPDTPADYHKSPVIQLVKISVLTLLLVVVFATLLSAADPIFADLIENLLEQAFGRAVLSIIIAIFATMVLTVEATGYLKDHNPQLKWFSFLEVMIPTLALASLFGFFLFVQAKYLFGAHEDIATFGLTYSQYVRRGFVELLAVTFIGSLLVYGIYLKQSVTEIKNHVIGYKLINSIIIAQLFLMLISALKRDFLYVEMFGITRTRIIGGIFIICLGAFLLSLLLLTLMKKMRERHLFIMLGVLSIFVAFSLNIINIDRVIALAPAPAHTFKDYFYINSLSEDAYEGWKESVPAISDFYENLYTDATPNAGQIEQFANYKLAVIALQEKRDALMNKYAPASELDSHTDAISRYNEQFNARERAIGAFNFSEFRAFNRMIAEQDRFFTQLDCLVTQMERYQMYYKIDTYSQETERLYQYEYPFVDTQRMYYPGNTVVDPGNGRNLLIPPISCVE